MAADRTLPFSKADAQEAAEWILRRRRGVHGPGGHDQDPDLERFPDPTDLDAVVQYVNAHQQVGPEVLREDALAVLVILDYQQGELDQRRLAAIRLARAPGASRSDRKMGKRLGPHGVTWAGLAAPLRVRTAQGAEQAYLRLVNALEGDEALGAVNGPRDERRARAARHRKAAEKSRQAQQNAAIRAFLTLALNDADGLPDDLLDDLSAYSSELDPLRHTDPVSPGLKALACATARQLLAMQVGGRLRMAVDHIAPELGLDVDRQLRLIEGGLLDGVVQTAPPSQRASETPPLEQVRGAHSG